MTEKSVFNIAHAQAREKLKSMKKIIFKSAIKEQEDPNLCKPGVFSAMKRIGIVGTRRRNKREDRLLVQKKFFELYEFGDWIVSGGCPKGGDKFAEIIAAENGIPILIFYPNYKQYGRYMAPKERNTLIADFSDILIACVSEDRRGGTEDTIEKFINVFGKGKGLLYLV
jgi:hypothetical protein